MLYKNDKKILVISVYLLITISICYFKPAFFFEKNNIKQFGIGKHKSIFNFLIFNIFLALFLYYIASI